VGYGLVRIGYVAAPSGTGFSTLVRSQAGSYGGAVFVDRNGYRTGGVMIVLGLTGSIGMGKTTAAAMFRELGAPVFDADRCVHELYRGPVVDIVDAIFPGVKRDGKIDRISLGERVFGNENAMNRLEDIIHPLMDKKKMNLLGTTIRLAQE